MDFPVRTWLHDKKTMRRSGVRILRLDSKPWPSPQSSFRLSSRQEGLEGGGGGKGWCGCSVGIRGGGGLFVCWLLNVPATCECISGTDLLRQVYVLPHWDRSCRSNFLSHPVTVYWHLADQSQCWPYNARRLAGEPLECQFLSHWYDSTPKKSWRKWDSNPGSSALEADALPLGQRDGREGEGRVTGLGMSLCLDPWEGVECDAEVHGWNFSASWRNPAFWQPPNEEIPILKFQLQKILFWGLFLQLLDTCCCLHFCLTGGIRAPKFAVENEKSVFRRAASHLHLTRASSVLDPSLVFLVLSFQKFYPWSWQPVTHGCEWNFVC